MVDLWPENLFDKDVSIEESNAVNILKEQARIINDRSNGAVKASFSRTDNPAYFDGLESMVKAIKKAVPSRNAEEEELGKKKSLDEMYAPSSYKFELYNETYRFRLLEIVDRRLFPVSIYYDEDIEEETKEKSPIQASSNKEIEEKLEMIFSSKKVRAIIHRMTSKKLKDIL